MLKTIPDLMRELSVNIRCISAEQAAKEVLTNNGLFIDVREPAEHENSFVPGTINIPRGVLEGKMLELEKDPVRAIYIHCAGGVRASFAAEQLNRLGYENVTAITCKFDIVKKAF
ncbi:hypothetical protein A9Q98_02420 [Thalassotalea sp. 42_200_T64]|nr:hypothetical protein A9Q98_02420 [Thalassotalea sp. 42_200_T64]